MVDNHTIDSPAVLRTFVITLPSASERQHEARRQLDAAGVPYQFFPAVDGETVQRSDDCRLNSREFLLATGRMPTPGEIGCFFSHRLAWQLCVQLGEPIVIMEDDFALGERFPEAHALLEGTVDELGFVRLQSERRAKKVRVREQGDFTIWRYLKAPNSAMCYAVSPGAAAGLLRHGAVIAEPVDVYMKQFWKHGQVMFGITPYQVTEGALCGASTIVGRTKARKSLDTRLQRCVFRVQSLFARELFNIRHRNVP